jgi:DNA segregation ATPase FtsK/SpoIIIE-like protein
LDALVQRGTARFTRHKALEASPESKSFAPARKLEVPEARHEVGVTILTVVISLARRTYSTWYGLAGAAIVVAGAGGLTFWFRGPIADGYAATQDRVLTTLGLGTLPIALWLAVFVVTLAVNPSWIGRVNLWLASLLLLASAVGFLALFDARTGSLVWWTLGGEVPLGGKVGEAIAGARGPIAGLRLAALFVVGAAIAMPAMSAVLAMGLGRLAAQAYVLSILAARATASTLGRMYRVRPNSRFSEQEAARHGEWSSKLKEALKAPPIAGAIEGATPRDQEHAAGYLERWPSGPAAPAALPGPTMSEDAAVTAESRATGWLEDQRPAGTTDPVDRTAAAGTGRFNKFWGSDASAANAQNPSAVQSYSNTDSEDTEKGPIVDGMADMWAHPPMDLLHDAPEGGISEDEMAETAEVIRRTLAEYDVEVGIGLVQPGPTVTMYGLIPGWVRRYKQVKVTDETGAPKLDESGRPVTARAETKTRVKVDNIMSREKDLSLALKTPSLRIETPAMGESLVGIEVPNPNPTLVTLRSVMEAEGFRELRSKAKLPIALGKGSGGEAVVVDLARMPHLLVAGATGSGKSVCINSIISCLIMEKTPAELRLLLVDPKRVELTPFNGIPHLLTPVVVETDQVVALLKGMIREMLQRYRKMEEEGVRNIDSYNRKMSDKMPYLVVAIDELADLMMSASFDVERSLCRLAQLGRATGIHLVVATQRPSVDVVTGLIKANFPSRISFGVTSQIDSRTILDSVGAEKLLGRGDMLYQGVEDSRPARVQGVFISDNETENLVDFWRTTPWAPLPDVSLHAVGDEDATEEDGRAAGGEDKDALIDDAIELAHHHNKLSTSLLQRRLRIGYPRAARLMDQLEDEGIVGPGDGSKSRDVIIDGI